MSAMELSFLRSMINLFTPAWILNRVSNWKEKVVDGNRTEKEKRRNSEGFSVLFIFLFSVIFPLFTQVPSDIHKRVAAVFLVTPIIPTCSNHDKVSTWQSFIRFLHPSASSYSLTSLPYFLSRRSRERKQCSRLQSLGGFLIRDQVSGNCFT